MIPQRSATGVRVLALLAAATATLAACEQDGPRGDPLKGGTPAAPTDPHAGMDMGGRASPHPALPSDHPPVPGMGGSMPSPMKPPASPQTTSFTWTAPQGWKQVTPSSTMRIAQFDLDATWPDGIPVQCAIFPAIGGGKQANIDRWIGQFQQADGSASKDKAKLAESSRDGLSVTRIELRGQFSDGMQKPPRQTDDGMLLGAIVEAPDGDNLYVKLTGPRAAIESEAARFDEFVASLRRK